MIFFAFVFNVKVHNGVNFTKKDVLKYGIQNVKYEVRLCESAPPEVGDLTV